MYTVFWHLRSGYYLGSRSAVENVARLHAVTLWCGCVLTPSLSFPPPLPPTRTPAPPPACTHHPTIRHPAIQNVSHPGIDDHRVVLGGPPPGTVGLPALGLVDWVRWP